MNQLSGPKPAFHAIFTAEGRHKLCRWSVICWVVSSWCESHVSISFEVNKWEVAILTNDPGIAKYW